MHPAHYYIKFMLITEGENEENVDTVNQTLKAFNLPKVEESDYERIRASLRFPKTLAIGNRKHRPTIRFMRQEQVYSMWMMGEAEKGALELLRYPLVKETAQLLLMGRMQSDEVVQWVDKKFLTKYDSKAIDSFRHYFWNSQLVSLEEWGFLLWGHPMRDHYLASFWGSRKQALYRAGFTPKVDGQMALKEAQRSIYMRLEATRMMSDTKDTARIIATLSKELVSVHMVLYGEGAGAEDAMKKLRQVRLQKSDAKVLPLRALAPGGNHSGSGKD